MTVRRATVRVLAPLRGRSHVTLVFDRAGAQEHVPVVLARVQREGRGHEQELGAGAGQLTVELGEAQVVTDRQTDLETGDTDDVRDIARTRARRLAQGSAIREVYVEQVDLVVAIE